MVPPIHLNPATDVADRVLLPGDPQRALAVSQALLDSPRMMNARRGLWGYTGTAPDGLPVTVQSTGMGGPSAAIVVEELIELGSIRQRAGKTVEAWAAEAAFDPAAVASNTFTMEWPPRSGRMRLCVS